MAKTQFFQTVTFSLLGAVLGAWTTTLFENPSLESFLWVYGGFIIVVVIIALVQNWLNKRN